MMRHTVCMYDSPTMRDEDLCALPLGPKRGGGGGLRSTPSIRLFTFKFISFYILR